MIIALHFVLGIVVWGAYLENKALNMENDTLRFENRLRQ